MQLHPLKIDDLAKTIHQQNVSVGWWDDPDRCIFECIQLMSTEVAEATEGERKSLMDDKLKHRPMAEVELADTFIRVVDFGGRYGIRFDPYAYDTGIAKAWKPVQGFSIGRLHLYINYHIIHLAEDFMDCYLRKGKEFSKVRGEKLAFYYSTLITCIVEVAAICGYDLEGAIEEKLAFNKTRPDHQRENRAAGAGPKF